MEPAEGLSAWWIMDAVVIVVFLLFCVLLLLPQLPIWAEWEHNWTVEYLMSGKPLPPGVRRGEVMGPPLFLTDECRHTGAHFQCRYFTGKAQRRTRVCRCTCHTINYS